MKHLFLAAFAFGLAIVVSAQSERYQKAMHANISQLDSLRSPDQWSDMANNFQRIADAEKTQWLPYYYAALGHIMSGYMQMTPQGGDPAKIDPLADKAEELLNKAENLQKDNSEIYVVKKMLASLRMLADPMNRWQTYGPMAQEALAKAKQLNPENPRVYLLEGQDKLFTPEQFGGSKTEAKRLLEESLKKYSNFQPESPLHPQWGKSQVNYFLSQAQ